MLLLGTAPESCTTWEHLLKPDYDKISFQKPKKTFKWFSRTTLSDLKHPYHVLIDVREGFDSTWGSSLKSHFSFSVTQKALPADLPENSDNFDNSDNWSVSVEADGNLHTSEF